MTVCCTGSKAAPAAQRCKGPGSEKTWEPRLQALRLSGFHGQLYRRADSLIILVCHLVHFSVIFQGCETTIDINFL